MEDRTKTSPTRYYIMALEMVEEVPGVGGGGVIKSQINGGVNQGLKLVIEIRNLVKNEENG